MTTSVELKTDIHPEKLLNVTFVTVVVLLVAHLVLGMMTLDGDGPHWLVVQLFDLDDENNLPTWFSSFLLLFASFTLHSIAGKSVHAGHYRLLGWGFLLLSIDEVAGLHESVNTAIEINWAIPGGIIALLAGAYFVPFLLKLPSRVRGLMVLSGILFLGGAVGVELLSADMDEESSEYLMAVAVEEGLEMFGVWLFLRTLLLDVAESGRFVLPDPAG